jgi:hypothetical protein
MAFTNRWFVRCRLCLSIAAIEGISLPKGAMTCSACAGPIEIMGRVDGSTSHLESRCKCDARCTNAKGPNCDCSCGGKNHGSGMLVTIDLNLLMHGQAAIVNINASEKALAAAKEFREALIPVNREIRLLYERGFLPRPDFERRYYLERVRALARKAKTHKTRMSILAGVK